MNFIAKYQNQLEYQRLTFILVISISFKFKFLILLRLQSSHESQLQLQLLEAMARADERCALVRLSGFDWLRTGVNEGL